VAETISPTRTCAIAPAMPNSSAAAKIVKRLNMSFPSFAFVFLHVAQRCACYAVGRLATS
jgi:hypothetical protein